MTEPVLPLLRSIFGPILDLSLSDDFMPEIQAFRGWRYNLGQVGDLSAVIAPPYDVIDAQLQTALYKQHPCNVVRLILNREEPGDDAQNNRYTRAANFLRQWKSQDVLVEEGEPAVYVYHQSFEIDGRPHSRKGFMARVRLERFGEGAIYAHEQTMPGPKADRLQLMQATGANLSPIFALYPDAACAAQNRLEEAVAGQPPIEATDHLGVVHRIWPLSRSDAVSAVGGLLSACPIFIADGHHRYETALAYRDGLQQSGKLGGAADPANFVLMMLVAMEDPGLVILPTHRLVSGLAGLTAEVLRDRLGEDFAWETIGTGPQAAEAAWEWMQADGAQEVLGFATAADNCWQVARLVRPDAMSAVAAEQSTAWRSLGVSILHELVLRRLRETADGGATPQIRYVHQLEEVQSALGGGGADTGPCDLACLVQPAGMEHLREVASGLEKMPAKSTYFYPKLLSGLVINPLR